MPQLVPFHQSQLPNYRTCDVPCSRPAVWHDGVRCSYRDWRDVVPPFTGGLLPSTPTIQQSERYKKDTDLSPHINIRWYCWVFSCCCCYWVQMIVVKLMASCSRVCHSHWHEYESVHCTSSGKHNLAPLRTLSNWRYINGRIHSFIQLMCIPIVAIYLDTSSVPERFLFVLFLN